MTATVAVAGWSPPRVRVEPPRLARGENGRVVVAIDVPDGCHVQSHEPVEPFLIATALELDDPPAGLKLAEPHYPAAEPERFDWSSIVLTVYRGTIEIVVPLEVAATACPGPTTISGRVRYQGCTETACLPPTDWPVDVQVEIIGTVGGEPRARA